MIPMVSVTVSVTFSLVVSAPASDPFWEQPDKKMAELHDLVVVPELNPNSDSFRMEQSLLRGELMRVNNFALLSENPSYSEMELRDVMNHYGLNLYNNEHL